jgi:TonB-dependent receptor
MKTSSKFRLALLPATISLLSSPLAAAAAEAPAPSAGVVEEVVVVGRLRTGATDVVVERLEQEVVVDLLSAEDITRVGDSDVAAALRRVPGLTLVNNEFIYVRGLGERYSSTLLNGAQVPSPDLTRNVIPLDIFPTAILDSLAVQKGYSADMPAAFGGGNINIRTKNIPTEPTFSIRVGSGWNFSSDDVIENAAIDDDFFGDAEGNQALSATLRDGIDNFQGNLSPSSIFQALQQDGGFHTFEEAQAINRQLATELNRDFRLDTDADADPDANVQVAAGNRYYFGENEEWEIGGLVVGRYTNEWRNRDRVNRSALEPTTQFFETQRTVKETSATGFAEGGLSWNDEQSLRASYMFLRNTENEASLGLGFNFNNLRADGEQVRNFGSRYEQRDLEVVQFGGEHELGGATLDLLGFVPMDLSRLEGLRFEWYYSDSTSETDIPNELLIQAEDDIDPATREVFATELNRSISAADHRFTDLRDEVESYGWDVSLPIYTNNYDLELSGGFDYSTKARDYDLTQFFLGTNEFTTALQGDPANVFTDANVLDPLNGFELQIGGIGTESYLAAQIIDAWYGKFDWTWQGEWRVSAGVRWEQFQQASLPIDRNQFDVNLGQVVLPVGSTLEDVVFLEDDYYPSVALTWIQTQRFGADDFQLRLGWSETVTRPDLREISPSVFIDPLTEARVRGVPGLKPAELSNFDLRGEWFWANGDNFTLSLFYKDISDPIETVQDAGSDDNIFLTFTNADEAELYGVELEFLKELSFAGRWLGDWVDGFFLQGNLTLSDSELSLDNVAQNLTNAERRLTQQSEWVVNVHLGYDSPDGLHSVSLVYNSFGERVFSAGRGGAEDSFEQPFHSLDLAYSLYPTENLTVRARIRNMLDEKREIEQFGVKVFEQEVGTTATLQVQWQL